MFGLFFTRRYVDHLERMIDKLFAEVRYQEQRADRALDALASQKTGWNITTALPAQPAEAEAPDTALREFAAQLDATHIGVVDETGR